MARIVALDIGGKRTGIAETDPMQIIATPKDTVETSKLLDYLRQLFATDSYETIVIGDPKNLDGGDSDNSERVRKLTTKLQNVFPKMKVVLQDERFSSKMAMQSMIDSGMKKMKRREKGEIDKVSAAIILQSYMEAGSF
ncbi:Holliday junction resolvase RuvX [Owenweeksia hongkongensis]|uniref:Putative pre-16S rRNA nuclease n=1 Tax=Owenweeksia hongkongensis (strain DSM 17368 / CIP 108786 / JCM 12287 / NRRL B-23963 / UST20020801) TaxID=926562 RepID=G8R616_OWEHD|nr:Holliday junction resolvase RuvX [Owenweeksia hongkongensis]AEV32206.1 RNAse H-fold protein YqgF [Owenweeksia hongkongensis DSM 17368]